MCLLLFGILKMSAEERHEEMGGGRMKILSVFLSRLNSGALPLEHPNAPPPHCCSYHMVMLDGLDGLILEE